MCQYPNGCGTVETARRAFGGCASIQGRHGASDQQKRYRNGEIQGREYPCEAMRPSLPHKEDLIHDRFLNESYQENNQIFLRSWSPVSIPKLFLVAPLYSLAIDGASVVVLMNAQKPSLGKDQ